MNNADARIQLVDPGKLQAEPDATINDPPLQAIDDSSSETKLKHHLFLLIALAFTAAFGFFLLSFNGAAPGRGGVDENAYLVSGRMLAEHGTTGFKPTDDYQFVGAMWMRTKSGWYYPKYPFGTSLLNAITVLLHKPEWAFAISPLCTALAVLGMFFLARPIVGSFYALLAMIVLAMAPTTLQFAILPDSHAPALCFVVWGMCFLLYWWQTGRWQWAVLAGLLLGYAVTIRYTEALLLFPLYSLDVVRIEALQSTKWLTLIKAFGLLPVGPIGIAVLSRIKWKSWRFWKCWRSHLAAALPILAWAVPVGTLLIYNRFTIGHFTGYDSTNESSGFAIKYFVQKWDFAVYQVYLLGLFIFAPLGIAGLILMYRTHRRLALLLTMWFVPGAFLYTAYYWGDNVPGVDYLRFFLTLFPPLLIAAMYLLRAAGSQLPKSQLPKSQLTASQISGSIASPLAAGLLTACAAAVGLHGTLDELVREHRGNMNLYYTAQQIISHIKPSPNAAGRPMILADEGMFPQLLQYMQFMYDADWYPTDIFAMRVGGGFGIAGIFDQHKPGDNTPVILQQDRIDYIDSFRKNKTDSDFIADFHHLVDQSLTSSRKVYVILPPTEASFFRHRFITPNYEMTELAHWDEPCNVPFPAPGEQSALAPSIMPDNAILPWHPQVRAMFEIRRATKQTPTTSAVGLR